MTESQDFLRKHIPRTTTKIEYECKNCKTKVTFHRDIFKKEQRFLEEKQIQIKLCQSCFIKKISGGLNNGL